MSLLQRLKQKEKECELAKEQQLKLTENSNISHENEPSTNVKHQEEDEWLESRDSKAIKSSVMKNVDGMVYETKLKAGVDLFRLVWAPYHNIKDRYFCGLLRDKIDIIGHNAAEVRHGQVVVELFHMPKVNSEKQKYIIMDEYRIKSYFGGERNMDYPVDSARGFKEIPGDNKLCWNLHLMDKMYNGLIEKHNQTNGKEIFRRIEHTAKAYLT